MKHETNSGFGVTVKGQGTQEVVFDCTMCGGKCPVNISFTEGIEHVGSGDFSFRNESGSGVCKDCGAGCSYNLTGIRNTVKATVEFSTSVEDDKAKDSQGIGCVATVGS